MIARDTPAQQASERARQLADQFVDRLTTFGYRATLGAPINYGHKLLLSHPDFSHSVCAVIYVGKQKASFVKEGPHWSHTMYDTLQQEFQLMLGRTQATPVATLAQANGSTVAYVDGSYCEQDDSGCIGWAFEIWQDGVAIAGQAGAISHVDALSVRNVEGECHAVEQVLAWCQAHDRTHIEIRFDFTGLEHWANGTWKANAARTQRYRDCVTSSGVHITWTKVQAHAREYGNTRVDHFARHAATSQTFFPELPISSLPAALRASRMGSNGSR